MRDFPYGGYLEGEQLYEWVARLVGDPSAVPEDEPRQRGSWWRRLLGLG